MRKLPTLPQRCSHSHPRSFSTSTHVAWRPSDSEYRSPTAPSNLENEHRRSWSAQHGKRLHLQDHAESASGVAKKSKLVNDAQRPLIRYGGHWDDSDSTLRRRLDPSTSSGRLQRFYLEYPKQKERPHMYRDTSQMGKKNPLSTNALHVKKPRRDLEPSDPDKSFNRRTRATSVLRSLLRECTYLPDPNARVYMREHILSRFKHDRPVGKITNQTQKAEVEKRQAEQLAEARRAYKKLREANAGYFRPLIQILLMTYGRSGKRRYDLMAPLKERDPSYVDAITKELEPYSMPRYIADRIPRLTAQLEALLDSQRLTRPRLMTAGVNPRSATPNPTKLNARKKPVAPERVKNELRAWYRTTMTRLLPPIPNAEWEELGDRASGIISFVAVERRARPLDTVLLYPGLLETLKIVEFDERKMNKERAHSMTVRSMQRLWEGVFMMCPVMDWDARTGKWLVQWGMVSKRQEGYSVKLSKDFGQHKVVTSLQKLQGRT